MRLLSVNVGSAVRLGNSVSGICKEAQSGSVRVMKLGLQNDAICDKKYHGGPDQAVYVYGGDDYDYWEQAHGLALEPGTFGDNLTIEGLSSLHVHVGDRLQIGDVELEATAPRIPCATLGKRMKDPKFPVAFRKSQRCGFYCRVLAEGELSADTAVIFTANEAPHLIAIVDMFELYYDPKPSRERMQQVLDAPIAIQARKQFQPKLDELNG